MRLIKKAHPEKVEKIVLGKDAYVDSLYGCFRFNNPKAEAFAEERDVELILRTGKKVHVCVPAAMKIDLPADKKLVNEPYFKMEKIGKHADTMHLLTMRAGWNQTDEDIKRMVALDKNGSFVAMIEHDGEKIPVATSSVLPLGERHTWIGMILVHPELRRQGIANAMMQHCVKYAINCGKIINGLDATPMGNTVYGAVGYKDSYRLWRSTFEIAEFAGKDYDKAHITNVTEAILPELIRYDSNAFLERSNVLTALFKDSQDGCFVYRGDNGLIQGYCFTRPGRILPFVGPFVTDSEEIAKNLLIAACSFLAKSQTKPKAFIDTPEEKYLNKGVYDKSTFDQANKPSNHCLIKSATPVRDFTRMYNLVSYEEVEKLVDAFIKAEKLDRNAERVKDFRHTMELATSNYTETFAFMEFEKNVLQKKYWGITGPEKG